MFFNTLANLHVLIGLARPGDARPVDLISARDLERLPCDRASLAQEGTTLVLTVRDTGVGLRKGGEEGTSFGLRQVRERLATLHGGAASLSLNAAGDAAGGTLAVIRMPLR
jgi:hypothetical protein